MVAKTELKSEPKASDVPGTPLRIGIIVDFLEYSYQMTVVEGARRAAAANGVHLIALAGGMLDGTGRDASLRNRLFKFVTTTRFDALIVLAGTLGNVTCEQILERVNPHFPARRVVFVAFPMKGAHSIVIDNLGGMRRIMEHLVDTHGYTKLAFIRGPQSNPEAEARFQAYKDVLESRGIPFREELVCLGEFRTRSGELAVTQLLDERKIKPRDIEAIVAADDLAALGAMDELLRRGFAIPSDIAVCGFDDVEEARYAAPPLTTVRQPLLAEGAEAVRLALLAIKGENAQTELTLDTTPIFRRSCGCTAEDSGFITERPAEDTGATLTDVIEAHRAQIVAELSESVAQPLRELMPGWQEILVDAIMSSLRDNPEAFRREFDRLLEKMVSSGYDVGAGSAIVSAFRRELSVCSGNNGAHIRRIEAILHDARLLTTDAVERVQAQRRLALERTARVLSDVSARLASAERRVRLDDLLYAQLPRLGIKTCAVSRYSTDQPGQAELVVAYGPSGKLEPKDGQRRFESAALVPPGIIPPSESRQLVVEPLFHKGLPLGFAVFAMGEVEGYVHEILQKILSLALYQTQNVENAP